MTMLWAVPLGVAALVVAVVAMSTRPEGGSENGATDDGWSFAPDGLRIAGSIVLLLGALAAVWVGIGDHQPRLVLSGTIPFDWATAAAVGVLSGLVGAGLFAVDRRSRRRA
jgi:hypothetical protein